MESRFWSETPEQLFHRLGTRPEGLSSAEASERLRRFGSNDLTLRPRRTRLQAFLKQLVNPLILVLLASALVSAALGEWVDAWVVLMVVLSSSLLSFAQEWRADMAVDRLRDQVAPRSTLLRDGQPQIRRTQEAVPGDIALLSAGSLIPADGLVLEAKDFFVSQSVLTGETFPVEKFPGLVPADATLAQRSNTVYLGTSVRSGTARVLLVRTGQETEFGHIAQRLSLRPPETEFERGIRRFGSFLTQIMFLLVLVVFAANIFARKPPIDSLLFAIALAVGMAPELLPAIITFTLARGAQDMVGRGMLVRRLEAIENFGSMDILCTDKTGTLTQGRVRLEGWMDAEGQSTPQLLRWAFLNASFQTGLVNPLDEAIQTAAREAGIETADWSKRDEIPYDFVRKRLSVVLSDERGQQCLITKGALEKVLEVCTAVRGPTGLTGLTEETRGSIREQFSRFSRDGLRVLGLATRNVPLQQVYTRSDETELSFEGFLLFADPPKEGIIEVLADLKRLGVGLKIITGDHREVALHLARCLGLREVSVLTGSELDDLRDEALWHLAERTVLFAEVDPNQKERIILALRKMGHVVGYLGDGINDAPALHAADVGISVESAADVAKQAADFVLLRQDLSVLRAGIESGRRTFANTLKYVDTTTSANFGNMFSMAFASMALPFLPLLAPQILLNNFLSDIPAMAIAGDEVDPELIDRPRRWDLHRLRDFMLRFGLLSSLFDFATFALLILVLKAPPALFRTAWFVESLLTELVIALVVRTHRPCYRSRPAGSLLLLTLLVGGLSLVLPYLPIGRVFGFVPLPASWVVFLLGILGFYVLAAEGLKHRLYGRTAGSEKANAPSPP